VRLPKQLATREDREVQAEERSKDESELHRPGHATNSAVKRSPIGWHSGVGPPRAAVVRHRKLETDPAILLEEDAAGSLERATHCNESPRLRKVDAHIRRHEGRLEVVKAKGGELIEAPAKSATQLV
jgi:hypothetical protein